ncbi:MAG: endonuclease/exonuclease/phosphatase family protein [Methylophaga sp.]|uniref:endonuclease/exonuclease/phosphatase family protein n=1 Tax=Methylophaga sp. TaxID=2024840 RepID=UPI00299E0E52|nr:endonuclease/exonuclease/phosphatase family protein [Methylophaga sp.]MDX1748850.1 endonuclease/exonuclease/phosphatase family protein [Methylophaga sp.]
MTIKPSERLLNRIFRIALSLFSLALVCSTAIPLIHTDQWWIRIFDFPRVQISVLMGLALAAYVGLSFWRRMRIWEYALAAMVVLSLIWQLIAIAPYTALYPNEMSESRQENDSNRISLLVYNVRYDNREVKALLKLIRDTDPDIILLIEPTKWWLQQLDSLENDYPFTLFQPQDNHSGMLLYSRQELVNPEIRFLIESEIPSIRTQVRLPSGKLVTLYGMHPRPPGLDLSEEEEAEADGDERADSDMRDAELMLVAKEVKELGEVPVIVAGDFNDVAWSHTTHLFQRTGGLLDPRVGRGLMNTFDTRSRLLRYPLDHAFASEHFLLVELRRLPDIGSDHFPLFVVLDYDPDASIENEEPQSDADDEQEAEEAIDKGKNSE